jgi:hypothetical protein
MQAAPVQGGRGLAQTQSQQAAAQAEAIRILEVLAALASDGSLAPDGANALANEVVRWPAGSAARSIATR